MIESDRKIGKKHAEKLVETIEVFAFADFFRGRLPIYNLSAVQVPVCFDPHSLPVNEC